MSILVCGGAGYIGSHTVHELIESGKEVVIVDNLQSGHLQAVNKKAKFYKGDIRDSEFLDKVFSENKIQSIIHFAANSLVGESMEKPLLYFNNNVYGMQILLESMVKHNIKNIVFSSTAAVYGEPKKIPILESDDTNPTNTYGETKLTMEKMMKWSSKAYGINYVALRYFNVAGALDDGSIGEDHNPETHLIPLILQVPLKKRPFITVFGTDYPTPDGTCIRDYIHVIDLAAAHIKAVEYLENGGKSSIFNLGNGVGFSVKEMIDAAREVTKQNIKVVLGERRSGDPAQLVASSQKAKEVLGWSPKFTNVKDIIKDAWKWHETHPNGFDA
ncbi:UDP-glucose 4-epimerase [Clostridium acetobutylicum]|uniref:UDP-glucose 4-epimerase n=1 Tax=Clostridium acetobutylicum (strain ATCC 824 / DSM 792 / JCM 1419 / IAM 19013 / LMG 5710 / NBRC 13948 / NRRL B-527 / VKM B-1787 / 2291 / W) TaxID=272562 RepID=Q97EZ5_CLOAB|nr:MULTISPECIES: UDP-glucose 4-epimerase GalE [Clostridium]AAK80902.1 UDP-galactose 4-epimerase [Clostridium acetobutylicum ATCC 824]ADZ22004.1 UDP-galactose 4-epimerase [Clostridium acetobutylicum EA 2018]AEI34353.1 UDP-galactose 4-epimerase [Clostridium acetobutylicum DSM 1731]AWV78686.1 UDP-glucose 4-epimerase GalE [Clostridium acetobutylicum]MBC2393549.1 UDP-glucose 4-epimerase GalE [Clostridium acetobutylicum]